MFYVCGSSSKTEAVVQSENLTSLSVVEEENRKMLLKK